MDKWLYDLLEYAFNKGVVSGIKLMNGDDDTYEAFKAVIEHCYEVVYEDYADFDEITSHKEDSVDG